jgi:hypothetical protein
MTATGTSQQASVFAYKSALAHLTSTGTKTLANVSAWSTLNVRMKRAVICTGTRIVVCANVFRIQSFVFQLNIANQTGMMNNVRANVKNLYQIIVWTTEIRWRHLFQCTSTNSHVHAHSSSTNAPQMNSGTSRLAYVHAQFRVVLQASSLTTLNAHAAVFLKCAQPIIFLTTIYASACA